MVSAAPPAGSFQRGRNMSRLYNAKVCSKGLKVSRRMQPVMTQAACQRNRSDRGPGLAGSQMVQTLPPPNVVPTFASAFRYGGSNLTSAPSLGLFCVECEDEVEKSPASRLSAPSLVDCFQDQFS